MELYLHLSYQIGVVLPLDFMLLVADSVYKTSSPLIPLGKAQQSSASSCAERRLHVFVDVPKLIVACSGIIF